MAKVVKLVLVEGQQQVVAMSGPVYLLRLVGCLGPHPVLLVCCVLFLQVSW